LFQKHKLSQEQAQEMVDVFNEVQKTKAAEGQETFKAQVDKWTTEKQADPEFKQKLALAQKGIARITKEVPSTAEIFNDPLWGNMPQFYELAQFIGKHMESEATALGGKAEGGNKPSILDVLYSKSMNKK
jgi:hypothetical protein